MIKAIAAPTLSSALAELKKITEENEGAGKRTLIFCEDRLTLAAERTVCAAVGGTFTVSVYTFARFLTAECGACPDLLSGQGSAMAIRKLIEENRDRLHLLKRLSTPAAAKEVYDTIALCYSSRVTAEQLAAAETDNSLLKLKLGDLSLLYDLYFKVLSESGATDRNSYLKQLPEVIAKSARVRGADVVFLGFQSFTRSVAECVSACMDVAANVYGVFLGGSGEFYTNEAPSGFSACALAYGGCQSVALPSDLCAEAETLRRNLFDPECFHLARPLKTEKVTLYEAGDCDDEMNFIAAEILRHVLDGGVRYRSVSVMLADMEGYRGTLERVFSEYGIPYYLDKTYKLSEHPLCAFLLSYLACVQDGCTQNSVCAAVSSPVFRANRKDKDIFVNYMLRLASYRGGVMRAPKEDILTQFRFDFAAVERVRLSFLHGLSLLPRRGTGEEWCGGVRNLLHAFGAEETAAKTAEEFKDAYPACAELSARAYGEVCAVVDEAEKLTRGVKLTAREFAGILKSGFTAAEVSLIPPKQDAVFVGGLHSTANTGSEVLFAAGLTSAVPAVTQDAALLSDRELDCLEAVHLAVSPKMAQVNMRAREMTALNLCAFRRGLYLTYPVRQGGDECAQSEVFAYAEALFASPSGAPLKKLTVRLVMRSERALGYACSRPLPALRQAAGGGCRPAAAAAICAVLTENGYGAQAEEVFGVKREETALTCGRRLYGGGVSPTALENYFSCPYKCFMRTGLRVAEREEGAMRPLDSGNFIHAALQKLAGKINGIQSEEELAQAAEETAKELLSTPQYASLNTSKRGKYTADALTKEAVDVAKGMYEQLANSYFRVAAAEQKCEIDLGGEMRLFGTIDRVDTCGEMVRIVDYKTGSIDSSASSYYMGLKLQLPLYLQSAAKGRRAVGAYYFPAAAEYRDKADGVYRMKGFMDGSEEVVRFSDTTLEEKKKSDYFDAYLNGRKLESAMPREEFSSFLSYSLLVAGQGADEMAGGNVKPSPAEGACKVCAYAGSCGFSGGADGEERRSVRVACTQIAAIAREHAENGRKTGGEKDGR